MASEVISMKGTWNLESEIGTRGARAVWASLKEEAGRKRVSVVIATGTEAASEILSSGMFYISGPGLRKNTLFRIEASRRARVTGCMIVRAVEAADPQRCSENGILREMHRILHMNPLNVHSPEVPYAGYHSEAS